MTARAYVLMTAMPPTFGHLHLIQFAAELAESAEIVVVTQPSEPYAFERLSALREATRFMNVNIHHIHKELPQEPEEAVGYWELWLDFLTTFGLQPHDYIVASESYGAKLAALSGAKFIPYDLNRSIYPIRATEVRNDPILHFKEIIPEFQKHMRRTVTVLGAESTGKTTLSKALAVRLGAWWLPEWARPYLESLDDKTITESKMETIFTGQKALQRSARRFTGRPFIVQDTDLWGTVGYYRHWKNLPWQAHSNTANYEKSDLYIVMHSHIPFEPNEIRYGGSQREMSDDFWRDLCEEEGLNFWLMPESATSPGLQVNLAVVESLRVFREGNSFGFHRKGQ